MANLDLSGYNLNELQSLQRDIANAIKERERQDIQKAQDQILAIAKDVGISVEELLGESSKKVNKAGGRKVQPQYQNPMDGSQTWTGRGRQPRWIAEALANGKTIDDFRIK